MNEMNERTKEREALPVRLTRAQLLTAAGAGLLLAAAPAAAAADEIRATGRAPFIAEPFFPQTGGTYTSEAIQDILNVAVTDEYLSATVATAALTKYASLLNLTGERLSIVQAILVEEQAHIDFLATLGAKPLFTSFTLAPPPNATVFFYFGDIIESLSIAAYMAAAREFAELGEPTLVKWAYQIGVSEAEHRAMARSILASTGGGAGIPPNNKAFGTDLLLYVRDLMPLLGTLGLVNRPFPVEQYPGREEVLAIAGSAASAVIQTIPNNASSSISISVNGPPTPATFAPLAGERS
jgi:hypothetical protein